MAFRSDPFSKFPTLKRVTVVTAALLAAGVPAAAQDCANADPWGVLAGVNGDLEIRADPQDPNADLILITNQGSFKSSIVAASVDGKTGRVKRGSLTTIADNFQGLGGTNGPEFVQKPSGELGVVYAGPGGVHATFRAATPTAWNAFDFDVAGNPVGSSPPALPSTTPGAYPGAPIPLGQNTYSQFLGDCAKLCYGGLDESVYTDVATYFAAWGLTIGKGAQAPSDGYLYVTACYTPGPCGIYEGRIDGAGAFVPYSIINLADTGTTAPLQIVAARHPATGSTVVFSRPGSTAIDVWEQTALGSALRLIKRVPVSTDSTHYRAESDDTQVVLHYLVESSRGTVTASYTLPVTANGGLAAGSPKKVSSAEVELAWLPAAGKWATFDRTSGGAWKRCWVTP